MALTRDWVSLRASVALAFAVAVLSILAGLAQIGGLGVAGPLAPYVPDVIRQTVGFTGTITGFTMLASGFALRKGYRVGWYSTAVLLPVTAVQGLMQASVLSFPLVALSVAAGVGGVAVSFLVGGGIGLFAGVLAVPFAVVAGVVPFVYGTVFGADTT